MLEELKYMYSFVCNDCGHSYVTDQKEICPFCESENLNVYQTVTYIDCKCGRQLFVNIGLLMEKDE